MFEKKPLRSILNILLTAFSFVSGEDSLFWRSPVHNREVVGTTDLGLMEATVSIKILVLSFLIKY